MNIILTLDNNNGMFFCGRRQSRDRVLNAHILRLTSGSRLLVKPYSAPLFADAPAGAVEVCEDPLSAGHGEFCFDEDTLLSPAADAIEALYVYRWNRDYPSDVQLDLDLSGWKKRVAEEFQGSSHDKITLEVYTK